ncbi:uncharacterized protein E6C27_scaffold418G001000 [Cucumis melo var. makuwa]|uniref:Retrotransposon Copia-like N-terminal domain-containing protein n=1 Tax=Cucumis melo var. makuwa TaxID=1194695 RepID=A0A5A7VPY0_CUCMM|nr:uncharacterized protein E6C27_scaffold418G001000 [Cucumis melo var. makuwa]
MTNAAPISVTATPTTSFTNPLLNQILNQLTTIKLDRGNYLLWKTLALPILKSYKLNSHLFGESPCLPKIIMLTTQPNESIVENAGEPSQETSSSSTAVVTVNPKYERWITTDLLLLGWLYNSMTPEVTIQLMGFTNAKDLWEATQDLFGIQSRAKEDFLHQTFQTTKKGNLNMEEYLRTMKNNVNNLGQADSLVPSGAIVS